MVDWISKTEYAAMTGKTVTEVQRLIDEGLLEAIKTDGGGKWMVKIERNDDIQKLIKIVSDLTVRVDKMSKHLGVRA